MTNGETSWLAAGVVLIAVGGLVSIFPDPPLLESFGSGDQWALYLVGVAVPVMAIAAMVRPLPFIRSAGISVGVLLALVAWFAAIDAGARRDAVPGLAVAVLCGLLIGVVAAFRGPLFGGVAGRAVGPVLVTLPEAVVTTARDRFCRICGTAVADADRYCGNCGAPVAPGVEATSARSPGTRASEPRAVAPPAVEPFQSTRRGVLTPTRIVLTILLFAFVGVGRACQSDWVRWIEGR